MSESFDPSWEKNIYSQGCHISRYPFGELVSYVLRLFTQDLLAGQHPRVLEVGCGTGNNLAFFAREGFETYGIEGSATACKLAKTFLEERNLQAKISHGDFVSLPFQDNVFDLVVDREAIYCNRNMMILKIASEVKRCLVPGGRFLTFTYSTEHGSLQLNAGETLEPNTLTNFTSGPFTGTGVTHFFTQDEIQTEYLNGFEIEYMYHHRSDLLFPENRNHYAEFITCAKKPIVFYR